MTWVSVSLRKMELKNRINNMESQLMDISQELQTIADESSNEQSKISLKNNYELGKLNSGRLSDMTSIFSSKTSDEDRQETVRSMLGGYFEDPDNATSDELDKFAEEFGLERDSLNSKGWFARLFTGSDENLDNVYEKMFGEDGVNTSDEKLLSAWMTQSQYLDDKLEISTLNQVESDTLRDETEAKTQALEAQQEALQTQLKAARAEYVSLGEALDKDIETSTIKLV
jgi:hypothetical protein